MVSQVRGSRSPLQTVPVKNNESRIGKDITFYYTTKHLSDACTFCSKALDLIVEWEKSQGLTGWRILVRFILEDRRSGTSTVQVQTTALGISPLSRELWLY